MGEPEGFQLGLQVELAAEGEEEAEIPLLRAEVLADSGEVEDRDAGALFLEAGSGADHEGALAHLSSGEHVAELAGGERLVELLVRLALDVGGIVGPQRA